MPETNPHTFAVENCKTLFPGARVKIARTWPTNGLGWNRSWTGEMTINLNKEATIISVDPTAGYLLDSPKNIWFPIFALDPIPIRTSLHPQITIKTTNQGSQQCILTRNDEDTITLRNLKDPIDPDALLKAAYQLYYIERRRQGTTPLTARAFFNQASANSNDEKDNISS